MEVQVNYLPPQYTEKYLPPIINENQKPNYSFDIQNSNSFNSPIIDPSTVIEYQTTSHPIENQETNLQFQTDLGINQPMFSEYESTTPQNTDQENNAQYQPALHSNINQPIISEYESTAQPNTEQDIYPQFQSPSDSKIIQSIVSEYESTHPPNFNFSTSQPYHNQEINPAIISENKSISQPISEQQIIQENQAIPQENTIQPIISEYQSTSQPNIKQTDVPEMQSPSQQNIIQPIISEYKSTTAPSLVKSNIPEEIITQPLDDPLQNQTNVNPSMVSKSNVSQNLGETVVENPLDAQKSVENTVLLQPKVNEPINDQQKIQLSIKQPNQQSINPVNNKSFMGKIPGVFPVYRLIRQGNGINPTEQQGIVFCAMKVFQEEILPLSNNTARFIQRKIGGDWLVIVYEEGKPIDFNMTCVEGNDYMYFVLDTTAYQVCRLR